MEEWYKGDQKVSVYLMIVR